MAGAKFFEQWSTASVKRFVSEHMLKMTTHVIPKLLSWILCPKSKTKQNS